MSSAEKQNVAVQVEYMPSWSSKRPWLVCDHLVCAGSGVTNPQRRIMETFLMKREALEFVEQHKANRGRFVDWTLIFVSLDGQELPEWDTAEGKAMRRIAA